METTTYHCDRCHNEDTNNQMRLSDVEITVGRYVVNVPPGTTRVQWCRKCCLETGLVKPLTKKEKESPPEIVPMTLEDLVREIVQDEMQYAQG